MSVVGGSIRVIVRAVWERESEWESERRFRRSIIVRPRVGERVKVGWGGRERVRVRVGESISGRVSVGVRVKGGLVGVGARKRARVTVRVWGSIRVRMRVSVRSWSVGVGVELGE